MWVRMVVDDCAGCHYACKAIQVAQRHLSVTHSVCNSGRDQKSDDQRAHLRPAAAAAAADVMTHQGQLQSVGQSFQPPLCYLPMTLPVAGVIWHAAAVPVDLQPFWLMQLLMQLLLQLLWPAAAAGTPLLLHRWHVPDPDDPGRSDRACSKAQGSC